MAPLVFLQEPSLTKEIFILAFWLGCVLLPWQRSWLKTRLINQNFVKDLSRGLGTIFCQMPWNSNDWIVRNRQVSAEVFGLNFSINCARAAFNWILSILKNPRIAGLFASLPFLTYLCYKRLLKTINTLRSITKENSKDRAGIEHKKWSLYQRHVCFCDPCARAESHQQERARKLCLGWHRHFNLSNWKAKNKSKEICVKIPFTVKTMGCDGKDQLNLSVPALSNYNF